MSRNLKPGEQVLCEVKPAVYRRGVFVRYITPRVWPTNPNDKSRCLVQFRHNKFPTIVQSERVSKDAAL